MHWETKKIVTCFITIFACALEPNLQYFQGMTEPSTGKYR